MRSELITCEDQKISIYRIEDVQCDYECKCDVCEHILEIKHTLRRKFKHDIYGVSRCDISWRIADPQEIKKCNINNYGCVNAYPSYREQLSCPDLLIVVNVKGRQKCMVVELKEVEKPNIENIRRRIKEAERQLESSCVPHCCKYMRKAILIKGINIQGVLNKVRDIRDVCMRSNYMCR